ncbi:hypothetical protein MXB_1831 [Myxobolus squamalis]|nr:hypothetical protein MXB_1831 [Myxobolus squamalis]
MISLAHTKYEFIQNFLNLFEYLLKENEFDIIFKICDTITRRSADLCAAGLAAILSRIECPEGIIAADGSFFKKHPHYICYVSSCLKQIIAEDGSGKGAALAACVAYSKNMKFSND